MQYQHVAFVLSKLPLVPTAVAQATKSPQRSSFRSALLAITVVWWIVSRSRMSLTTGEIVHVAVRVLDAES